MEGLEWLFEEAENSHDGGLFGLIILESTGFLLCAISSYIYTSYIGSPLLFSAMLINLARS